MKILVTGGTGFIGYYVCQQLKFKGHEVISLDRPIHSLPHNAERIRKMDNIKLLEIEDISNFDAVKKLIKEIRPEVVVHLAGQYSVRYRPGTTMRYLNSNVMGFMSVLEASLAANAKRFLYASSIAVSDQGMPSGLYGATKGFNEQAAHAYSNKGMAMIGLRYGVVYGPMLRSDSTMIEIFKQLLAGQEVPLTANLLSRTPYIEVADAAEATARLVECNLNQNHNIALIAANEASVSLRDCLAVAANYLGKQDVLTSLGGLAKDLRTKNDPKVLRELTGFNPSTTIEQGIPTLIEWLRRK